MNGQGNIYFTSTYEAGEKTCWHSLMMKITTSKYVIKKGWKSDSAIKYTSVQNVIFGLNQ